MRALNSHETLTITSIKRGRKSGLFENSYGFPIIINNYLAPSRPLQWQGLEDLWSTDYIYLIFFGEVTSETEHHTDVNLGSFYVEWSDFEKICNCWEKLDPFGASGSFLYVLTSALDCQCSLLTMQGESHCSTETLNRTCHCQSMIIPDYASAYRCIQKALWDFKWLVSLTPPWSTLSAKHTTQSVCHSLEDAITFIFGFTCIHQIA